MNYNAGFPWGAGIFLYLVRRSAPNATADAPRRVIPKALAEESVLFQDLINAQIIPRLRQDGDPELLRERSVQQADQGRLRISTIPRCIG